MSGTTLTIEGPDGAFSGYLARPAGGKWPGVVVIQEIFGVNKVMRDICDGLAAQGYVALCPDLFWRIEPGIQLTDKTDAEWKRAFELFQAFDVDAGLQDLQATITALRGQAGVTGKVGTVGYCLGGLLAYLTATRTDADCAVGYYGVGIEGRLAEAGRIKKPLLLHIAGKDQFVPPAAQKSVREGLAGTPLVSILGYAENDHAFARVGGAHYDARAAGLANAATAAFFAAWLG
ncbi:MAG: dienelactone hydrolase family protein [Alphaproteobacteria bacterium]|nr:dienelactone hydrolase family protein [Alphaproteobacteria bacterium]